MSFPVGGADTAQAWNASKVANISDAVFDAVDMLATMASVGRQDF
jgi:hypothetical protein